MNPFLDHDDLRKTSRAVIVLAIIFLLISKCTSPFNQFILFGMSLRFGLQEARFFFGSILAYYSFIYVSQLIVINPRHRISEIRQARRQRISKLRKIHQEEYEEVIRQKEPRLLGKRLSSERDDFRLKYEPLRVKRESKNKRAETSLAIASFLEIFSFCAFQCVFPVLFVILAFLPAWIFDTGTLVCSQYRSEILQAAGIP